MANKDAPAPEAKPAGDSKLAKRVDALEKAINDHGGRIADLLRKHSA